jgi:solute carrier family 25 folate transporter 32
MGDAVMLHRVAHLIDQIYDKLKHHLGVVDREHAPAWKHCLSAMGAAAVCNIVTNPLWVVRTRMISAVYHKIECFDLQKMSVRQHLAHIVRQEGFLALYKGLAASLIGLSHVALQFPLYELFKEQARARTDDGKVRVGI